MKKRLLPCRPQRRHTAAFSLVEVALALGVVGFALVGIVGALPVAMNNERMSVAQTRAASVAGMIFARFRAQPFGTIQYADDNLKTLDLNTRNTGSPVVLADAVFDEVAADARRLHIYSDPSGLPPGTLSYKIVMRFRNSPPGMLAPYTDASGTLHASGNAIELSVYQDARPTDTNYYPRTEDVYHFNTVIANRMQ